MRGALHNRENRGICSTNKHPQYNTGEAAKPNYTCLKGSSTTPYTPAKKKEKQCIQTHKPGHYSLPAAGSTGRQTGKSILQQVLKKQSLLIYLGISGPISTVVLLNENLVWLVLSIQFSRTQSRGHCTTLEKCQRVTLNEIEIGRK